MCGVSIEIEQSRVEIFHLTLLKVSFLRRADFDNFLTHFSLIFLITQNINDENDDFVWLGD